MIQFCNLNNKYLALIPFLALNFAGRVTNGKDINLEKINENLFDQPHIIKNFKSQENIYIQSKFYNLFYLLAENINSSNINKNVIPESLDIISDSQYKSENKYIVEGDVQIRKNNMQLQSDKLEYDLEKKIFKITGNINFIFDEQFFEATEIKYSLISKEGFIKDVYGTINFDKLDLINTNKIDSNFKNFNKIDNSITNVQLNDSSGLEIKDITLPEKLKIDVNRMAKWRFKTDEITIKDNIWSAKVLYLTNDPYNKPKLVIRNSNFKSFQKNGEFLIKSKWSSIILEDKIKIPLGPRNFKATKGNTNNFKWGFGYDQGNKDGLYITRYSDPESFGIIKDFKFKNEFYIQRALTGTTKSFSKKNDSILSEKSKQDAKISDYFGFGSELKASFLGLNLDSEISLNSLDLEKFKKIIKLKTELSKILHSYKEEDEEKDTKLSLFGIYRDKVWNGSIG